MSRRILHQGVVREFQAYLPPDWLEIPPIPTDDPEAPTRNGIPLPVVVFFHGGNSSISDVLLKVNLHDISRSAVEPTELGPKLPVPEEDKFITLYVQGLGLGAGGRPTFVTDDPLGGGSWNDGGPTGHLGEEASVHRADDVGLVHRILDLLDAELTATYREVLGLEGGSSPNVLDRRRIFLAGFSGGAALVYRLAADPTPFLPYGAGFRFAAIAPVAGTAGGFRHNGDRNNPSLRTSWDPSASEPAVGSLHILAIHGTQDRQVGSQYFKAEERIAALASSEPDEDPEAFRNETIGESPGLAKYLLADEMTLGWTSAPAVGSPPVVPPDGDASFDNARVYKAREYLDEDLGLVVSGLGYDDARAKALSRWDFYLDASVALWTRFMGMADIGPDLLESRNPDAYTRSFNNSSDGEELTSAFVYSDPPEGTGPLYGGKVVRVILLDGEQHTWPRPGFGKRPFLNIDATRVIWSFFKEVSFL